MLQAYQNSHIGDPEGEETGKRAENVSEEIVAENFPNLAKKPDIQVNEAQRVQNRIKPWRLTPRFIIIKISKN